MTGTTVYLAICIRGSEPTVRVFSTAGQAVQFARGFLEGNTEPEDRWESTVDNSSLYRAYSGDGEIQVLARAEVIDNG